MTRTELEELNDIELLKLGEIKGAELTLLSINYKRENKKKLEELTELANLMGDVAVERGLLEKNGKLTEKGKVAKEAIENSKREVKAANRLNNKYGSDSNKEAGSDVFWGAMWCIGGIVATVADFGYIFWGAIVFGGFQFFRGIINYNNS